ncbi:unnamed protein product [Pleuronectes platessa]|uniref:Uncharacterized protein n=1 Tax=Pleuronectes platessa TaxID=8262 RepID=A0A9N7TR99_PLEPL|nr:unnamed protein product [Pleuronectes platessa]
MVCVAEHKAWWALTQAKSGSFSTPCLQEPVRQEEHGLSRWTICLCKYWSDSGIAPRRCRSPQLQLCVRPVVRLTPPGERKWPSVSALHALAGRQLTSELLSISTG